MKTLYAIAALILGAGAASAADVYNASSKDTYPLTAPAGTVVSTKYFKGGYLGIEGGLGAANNEIGVHADGYDTGACLQESGVVSSNDVEVIYKEDDGEILYDEETGLPIVDRVNVNTPAGVVECSKYDAPVPYSVDAILDGAGADLRALGLTAGWNFRFGRFVVGPAAYYNWLGGSTDADIYLDGLGFAGASFEYLSRWGIGGRAGFVPWEHTLIYTGLYFTRLNTEASAYLGKGSDSKEYDFNGWQIVAGGETMITDDVGIKLEGSYANYESKTLYNDGEGFSITSQPSIIEIKAGVNFHLN